MFFPGSTIGNFSREEALEFLGRARELVGPGGGLLIGADLHKNARVLEAAYNDAAGVTADFNLNVLQRINRELGGDFNVSAFRHHAFYDVQRRRIEMHLVSTRRQEAHVGGRTLHFDAGETIHTENSHKYSVEDFQALARAAGLEPRDCWLDSAQLFSIHYLETP